MMFRDFFSILLIFLLHLVIPFKAFNIPVNERDTRATSCGYQSCPKIDPKKLNIHLVVHTHDDVGWLKTVEQYYYGGRPSIQLASVQYILDSVIEALEENPERRFIYVETAFFWKWWQQQNDNVKRVVKNLINEGRLEFIGGAWSMNDEAVTHYQSIIDQFTLGLSRLNETFGECGRPKVGWQIDPFGHSREQASIFSQMGYDGLLIGRLDYKDKSHRLANKMTEFIWKSNPSLGSKADLFTSVLYNFYKAPSGFCFDIVCEDEPLIDDPDSPDYNMDMKMESFLEFCQIQAESYMTNNIILTMGEDFNYQIARAWFVNLEKLIKYITLRNGTDFNVFYSTPSCYLKAVNDIGIAWPTKDDDFFPYGSDSHSYWTGYFTSRPTLKFFERLGNNFLQVVKQLAVLSGISSNANLDKFREAMGILQHHDAVAGTEQQHVANDYARILHRSMKGGEKIAITALRKLLSKKESANRTSVDFHSCLLLNISSCRHTEENDNFIVTIYNPTSQLLKTFVRLPVAKTSYTVVDCFGAKVVNQMVPIPSAVINIPGRVSAAKYELIFPAVAIAPLGFRSYYISQSSSLEEENLNTSNNEISNSIGGEKLNISIDEKGKIRVSSKFKKDVNAEQSFCYYEAAQNGKINSTQRNSGAYVFRPKENTNAKCFDGGRNYKYYKGPLVEELHVEVNDWISQIIRAYNGQDRVEFNWLIGPINVSDNVGREVVTRYTTNLKSNEIFFTDSNGRQMLRRRRNSRPTWNQTFDEVISSNYYPVATKIFLQQPERKLKLSVFTDRSEGGTSLQDGELELMLHRRLLMDDGFGVVEPLNEEAFGTGLVVRGEHVVFLGEINELSILDEKEQALQLSLKPWTFITPLQEISFDQWKENFHMQGSSLGTVCPPNVRILTLEPWKEGSVLLRLEHIFESNESSQYSRPEKINIENLFSKFKVTTMRETNLSGNQWVADVIRRDLNTLSNLTNDEKFVIHINSFEIKTFVLQLERR